MVVVVYNSNGFSGDSCVGTDNTSEKVLIMVVVIIVLVVIVLVKFVWWLPYGWWC